MRRGLLAAVTFAAAMAAFGANPSSAQQGQSPLPGFRPPPAPPIKPYQAVPVTAPPALNDPGFIAFRKQLADVAARKDRGALAKMVVTQNFFWIPQDKDLADQRKTGIDNLFKAIDSGASDDAGWQVLAGFATEPTAAESPQQPGVFCAPADPNVDQTAFEALMKATQSDPSEWGYPGKTGLEVHAAAQPNSPVVDKLGMNLVHVLPDTAPPANPNDPLFLHIATPSGKSGYVDGEAISPLGGDQICYTKQGGAWKINGYLGGGVQQ